MMRNISRFKGEKGEEECAETVQKEGMEQEGKEMSCERQEREEFIHCAGGLRRGVSISRARIKLRRRTKKGKLTMNMT